MTPTQIGYLTHLTGDVQIQMDATTLATTQQTYTPTTNVTAWTGGNILMDQSGGLGGWVAQRLPNSNTQYGDTDRSIATANSGTNNCAMGAHALYGIGATGSSGSYNVAVGSAAKTDSNRTLGSLTNGSYNTATGYGALRLASGSASYNTGIGALTLSSMGPASQYNTGIGYLAGFNVGQEFSGTRSTFLGANTSYDASGAAAVNSTAIGYGATIRASGQIVMGTATEYVYVAGTADSIGTVSGSGSGALVVAGGTYIGGNVVTRGNATVYGNAFVSGNLTVNANTTVYGNTLLVGNTVAGNVVAGNTITGNLVVNSTSLFRQVVSVVSAPVYQSSVQVATSPSTYVNTFYIDYTSYPSTSSRCWLDMTNPSISPTGDVNLCIDKLPVSTTAKMNYRFSMVLNSARFINKLYVRTTAAAAAGGSYQTPQLYCANGAIGSVSVGTASYVDQRIEIVVEMNGTVVVSYTDITPLM